CAFFQNLRLVFEDMQELAHQAQFSFQAGLECSNGGSHGELLKQFAGAGDQAVGDAAGIDLQAARCDGVAQLLNFRYVDIVVGVLEPSQMTGGRAQINGCSLVRTATGRRATACAARIAGCRNAAGQLAVEGVRCDLQGTLRCMCCCLAVYCTSLNDRRVAVFRVITFGLGYYISTRTVVLLTTVPLTTCPELVRT